MYNAFTRTTAAVRGARTVTIRRDGSIGLSAAAYGLLGRPESVSFHVGEGEHDGKFLIAPALDAASEYPIIPGKEDTHAVTVYARDVRDHLASLQLVKRNETAAWPAMEANEPNLPSAIVIDLNKPGIVRAHRVTPETK